MSKNNCWTVIDEDAGILTWEYSFGGGGKSNAFAVRMGDGQMMVVSPPSRCPEQLFVDLESYGPIGALVANNGFHHLGLPEWKRKFPDAICYASPLAAARIAKKNKRAPDLQPLEALVEQLDEKVGIREVENTKCGECWVWAATSGGDDYVWYASDVLSNFEQWPKKFMPRTFLKLTGSQLGFAVFHTGLKFIVRDRKATLRQMLADIEEHPPTAMVPAHGAIVRAPELGAQTRAVIEGAL